MLAAFAPAAVSTAVAVFVTAQLLQGTARAIFWTSSQTHAVRGGGRPVDRLVDLNVAGNAGTLVGPALAGTLAAFGLPFALVGRGHRGGRRDRRARRSSSASTPTTGGARSGRPASSVATGSTWPAGRASSVAAGGRCSARTSRSSSSAPGSGPGRSAGSSPSRRAPRSSGSSPCAASRPARIRPAVVIGSFGTAASRRAWPWRRRRSPGLRRSSSSWAGSRAATVTTLGPALASLAATADEQGDALSLTGMFRAAALLATPAAVGALLGGRVALPAALSLLGVGLGLPGAALTRSRRGTPPGVRAAGPASP